ncbi:MAG: DUF1156 domain-containing protein, partial [Polyangiaceae bacterium]|nr:DUF1156 domain-containing protein [Polyangiaceae bacterium]
MKYPRRLIEYDLPIRSVSQQARREKSIRHGHIATLHTWWARRPLASCRAVTLAALWLDSVDPVCPEEFRLAAAAAIEQIPLGDDGVIQRLDDPMVLRRALLEFIAQYSNWDKAADELFNSTARQITQAAHKALGFSIDPRPMVLDPFAGGGAIPVEALRVGADAFASDLNPVAVIINKALIEHIPKYGTRLRDEVMRRGELVLERAREELGRFYPSDPDEWTPLAYLWARTILCEGPDCGARVPLMRSMWLSKRAKNQFALSMMPTPEGKGVRFEVLRGKAVVANDAGKGTVARGSAHCPICGFTTRVDHVRRQLRASRGGADGALLVAVVRAHRDSPGRHYREARQSDMMIVEKAREEYRRLVESDPGLLPSDSISPNCLRRVQVPNYGMTTWASMFSARQALAILTFVRLVREFNGAETTDGRELSNAVRTFLALAVGRVVGTASSLARWDSSWEKIAGVFSRQAIPIVWDYAEPNVTCDQTGGFTSAMQALAKVFDANSRVFVWQGVAEQASAMNHVLPDESVDAVITDPPYYDAVSYSYLSDYFYVWLRRMLGGVYPSILRGEAVPKADEVVVDPKHSRSTSIKDVSFYENALRKSFCEMRRVLRPEGIAVVVFASKSTASWEAILEALIDSGFVITGSWPIDTEMENRVAAIGQARLMSSIHIVCRPRRMFGATRGMPNIGDWGAVLAELPVRMHEWLPRLAREGIVGADAIFSCLGPALEIFSRYTTVEKASGGVLTLRAYLEQVWAAVSKEALSMIFKGADTSRLEADARVTAIWLWTLAS